MARDEHGQPLDVRLREPSWEEAKELRIRLNPRDHRFEPLEKVSRADLQRIAHHARRAWEIERLASHHWRWRCAMVVLDRRFPKRKGAA